MYYNNILYYYYLFFCPPVYTGAAICRWTSATDKSSNYKGVFTSTGLRRRATDYLLLLSETAQNPAFCLGNSVNEIILDDTTAVDQHRFTR